MSEVKANLKAAKKASKAARKFYQKKRFILPVVLFGIIVLVNMGGSDDPKVVSNPGSTTTETATTETATAKVTEPTIKEFYAINEAVQSHGATVTVTKVVKSNGSDYDTPKSGNEYVIVSVSIENSGSSEISYNPYDFKMQNSKGQITDGAFAMVNQDTALESGSLATGGSIKGTLIFEQPKDDKSLVLKYNGNIFAKDIQFKLN